MVIYTRNVLLQTLISNIQCMRRQYQTYFIYNNNHLIKSQYFQLASLIINNKVPICLCGPFYDRYLILGPFKSQCLGSMIISSNIKYEISVQNKYSEFSFINVTWISLIIIIVIESLIQNKLYVKKPIYVMVDCSNHI